MCFTYLSIKLSYVGISLTCITPQWDALAISELVSWAAVEAAICRGADDAVCRTGCTLSLCRVEEPLLTDVITPTLKKVSGYAEAIWMEQDKKRKSVLEMFWENLNNKKNSKADA